ncbi:DUF4290 domain-containing protein [Cryomorphaceae bacterium]|nr:DUF4290 domain-containing protein [Cryomorphaceae bacterium]
MMQYNTEKEKLKIPEYGRHVQQMVDYAVTIEDKEKRQKVAQAIIDVIGNLNPHLRDVPDFKHKLWDHLFIMSDFELDVESPYPKPTRDSFEERPDKIDYPQERIKYRYYGKNVIKMIETVSEMEDLEHRPQMIRQLANHMKKSYLNWNKDSVEDKVILDHLAELSAGKLALNEDQELAQSKNLVNSSGNNSNQRNNNRKRSNNNKKRNYKRRK